MISIRLISVLTLAVVASGLSCSRNYAFDPQGAN